MAAAVWVLGASPKASADDAQTAASPAAVEPPPPATRSTARANAAPSAGVVYPLRWEPMIDLPFTAIGGAAWIVAEVLKGDLAPNQCRWCDRDASGHNTLNSLDRSARNHLRWSDTDLANTLSSVLAFGIAPVSIGALQMLGDRRDARPGDPWVDSMIILESAVIAANINEIVKVTVARERPFVHVLTDEQKLKTNTVSENNMSFFSGHSTLAFSLAAAGGTVASMRHLSYAPWVWATGMTLAALTGYLRIAGDRHYLTDVLTGGLMGSAVGLTVPFFFHGPSASAKGIVVQPMTNLETKGIMLSGTW